MPVRFIGRESYFHGRSLFEIARNLKSFGEGRMVFRVNFNKRYAEPSYYRLTSVKPEMNAKGYFKGIAYGEKVFRGQHFGNCKIDSGNKQDWRLVPKDEEHLLSVPPTKEDKTPVKKIPQFQRLPPLMELILRDELKTARVPFDDSRFFYKNRIAEFKFNRARLDTEDDSLDNLNNKNISEKTEELK